MKGAQLGVTEAAINRALYTIDKLKRDVLYVLPTAGDASDFSKARFGSALDNSLYLKSIFTDTNAVNIKRASANTLYIRGSRGHGGLKSVPVSELILDELDEMDQGRLWLAKERAVGSGPQAHLGHFDADDSWLRDQQALRRLDARALLLQVSKLSDRWTELIWPDCVQIVGDYPTDPRCARSPF